MRVYLAVGGAAIVAAAVVVGGVLATRTGEGKPTTAQKSQPGAPPLVLDLGVRTDPEAKLLRRAAALYDRGRRAAAGRLFAQSRSLQSRVGGLFAAWPDRSLDHLEQLAHTNRRSAFLLLHLGLARFWAGKPGSRNAWREALERDPDSASAEHADDLLHPSSPRGRPIFVPSFSTSPAIAKLPPPRQFAALERAASTGGVGALLLFWIGQVGEAERQLRLAAAEGPNTPLGREAKRFLARLESVNPS